MPLPIRALHPTSSLHQNTFGSRRELTSSIPSRPSPHAAHRIAVLPSFVASSIVLPSFITRPSPPWSPRSHRPPIHARHPAPGGSRRPGRRRRGGRDDRRTPPSVPPLRSSLGPP